MGGCLSYRVKLVRDRLPNEDSLLQNVTTFSVRSLKKATNNFSTNRLIRQNRYSKSYKGILKDGSVVIVKDFSFLLERVLDFTSMIKLMSGVRHQNVVELIGYCIEDDQRMVVHEFVGDYTLDQLLLSDSRVGDVVLDWPSRVSICHGIARALDYLHNGVSPRVVVRDVKPRNILMDCSFNPKIMDFDISCLLEDGESHHSGNVVGTIGYMDHEYAMTGRYSEKTDVYAFGITLLEIISGRRYLLPSGQDHKWSDLGKWAWELRLSDRIPEIADPTLSEFSEDEVTRFVNVALSCVQCPSGLRPSMSEVRLMLSDGYDFSKMVITRPELPTTSTNLSLRSSFDELSPR